MELTKLIKNHPISQEGMRTIATAELLSEGIKRNMEIRECKYRNKS